MSSDLGGYWSVYWYNGRIYATEIARGLDVFALEPSEFLSAEEIAAAGKARYPGNVFNPQTQTQVSWPADVLAALEQSRKRSEERRVGKTGVRTYRTGGTRDHKKKKKTKNR